MPIISNEDFTAECRGNLVFVSVDQHLTNSEQEVMFTFAHDNGELVWTEPATLDFLTVAHLANEAHDFAKNVNLIHV